MLFKRLCFSVLGTLIVIVLLVVCLEYVAELRGLGQKHDWRFREDVADSVHQTYDFAVIGGSTSFGFGLDGPDTWVRQLEGGLSKSSGETPVRVLNLARIGSHLEEEIYSYRKIIKRPIPKGEWSFGDRPADRDLGAIGFADLSYQHVLLVPVINDTAPLLYGPPWYYRLTPLFWFRKLLLTMNGVARIDYSGSLAMLRLAESKLYHFDESRAGPTKQLYAENLAKALDVFGRERIVLVGLPIKYNSRNYTNDEFCNIDAAASCLHLMEEAAYLTKAIAIETDVRMEMSKLYGVRLCELSNVFVGEDAVSVSSMFIDSIHLSSKGSRVISCELEKCLHGYGLAKNTCAAPRN